MSKAAGILCISPDFPRRHGDATTPFVLYPARGLCGFGRLSRERTRIGTDRGHRTATDRGTRCAGHTVVLQAFPHNLQYPPALLGRAPLPVGVDITLLFVGNNTRRKGADLLPKIMDLLPEHFRLRYTAGLRDQQIKEHTNVRNHTSTSSASAF